MIIFFSNPNTLTSASSALGVLSGTVVYADDAQKAALLAAGYVAATRAGPYADRPASAAAMDTYWCLESQCLLIHDGVQWRNADTGQYLG
jgi:hypothetical protein